MLNPDQLPASARTSFESESMAQKPTQQSVADVQEVWFPGGHCDVGGGLQDQLGQRDLFLISFQWMIKECFANITGILFDYAHLTALGVDLHQIAQELRLQPIDLVQLGLDEEMLSLNTQHQIAARFPGHDGAPEIWDELNRTRLWWIAECFANYRQEEYLLGMKGTGVPNLGRGRYIPLDGEVVRVHSSVKLMPKDYKPRAYNWDIVKDYIQWVD